MTDVDLVWLRHDLRLRDHPALSAAGQRPLLVLWTADGIGLAGLGRASRLYLQAALQSFKSELERRYGLELHVFPSLEQGLKAITREVPVARLLWNRGYEPGEAALARHVQTLTEGLGIKQESFPASVLYEPGRILNKSGQPFKVFTAFYRSLLALGEAPAPLAAPASLKGPRLSLASAPLDILGPGPALDLSHDLASSEDETWQQWLLFRDQRLAHYPTARDIPAEPGNSRLSTALRFGLISPRSIWADARQQPNAGTESFLRQLVWRDFAIHSLYHMPSMEREPILEVFQRFPWADEPLHLKAWQEGRTGYPIVDAGMRELNATGLMHNRLRMIVGSFLVKNLHIDWRQGAAYFWDRLLDADRANNSMGWQWVSGCGIDPSPYFRIFNPSLQSEKFDPEGRYIKHWLPELKGLPSAHLHRPWLAPAAIRKLAGDYPPPIVDFAKTRQQALMFYDRIKAGRAPARRSKK